MKYILWMLLAAVVIIGIGFILLGDVDTNIPASGGADIAQRFDPLPPFVLKDYDETTVTSEDFQGKILVVNSWATWCPFCVDELPDFVELQKTFPDEIVIIAIDRQESRDKAKGFTDSLGISNDLIYLLDPRDSFYQSIGGFAMPETLFVDPEGNIRIHKRGPMEFSEMREKIESLLTAQN